MPPGQVPIHDDHETVDTVWVRPDDALARAKAGEFDLIFPTMKNLEAISRFATSGELLAAAAAVERVPTVLPRVVADERGFRILLPGDPGYDEAVGEAPRRGARSRHDPVRGGCHRPHHRRRRPGRARRLSEPLPLEPAAPPQPGRPVALSALVVRVTAPNPGMMTGPGTNTYLVGTDALVVVDPGPDDAGHLDALAELGAGRIRWIVVTHTHPDHAPGAAGLAARTGAEVLGFCAATVSSRPGPWVTGFELRRAGLHPPGRCTPRATPRTICAGCSSRSRCSSPATTSCRGRRWSSRRPTGTWPSTCESLRAPRGPGPAGGDDRARARIARSTDPAAAVEGIVEHRLARERAVALALARAGRATVDELLPTVYADVRDELLPVARQVAVGPPAEARGRRRGPSR